MGRGHCPLEPDYYDEAADWVSDDDEEHSSGEE